MPIFKAFFNIVKKNKMTFVLAIAINLAITFAYSQVNQTDNKGSFDADKSPIAIINQDTGATAKELESYLRKNSTVVTIDPSEKGQQDALFFKKVLYIVTIPKNFSTDMAAGEKPAIPTKAIPSSQADFQTSTLINQFVNKVAFYYANFPEKSETAILKMVATNLGNDAAVSFEPTVTSGNKNETARIFNLLAYGLFMTILSSIGIVSLSMNRQDVKDRNNCSPLSERKRSTYFYSAVALFSLISWVIFVAISLVLSKSSLGDSMTHLLLLNAFVFLLAMISLAVTVSYFVTTTEMISGLNNILVLGTCFISGAFVPQEMMSEPVLKIASFFPTYWYITNNHLVANLETYSSQTLAEFYFNIGILLLFVLAFALIGFILRREQGGLSKKKRKSKLA
ncbi:ABC transporter permease [uncultured Vagococcus sp.]|uniref:ABC transporter permease n=1 Tax=uncultured Vagococcus sp. TaxID=189676 RepID=UPI0028D08902|nr:ABC transporter permease [uncultured Vagococcus sp.]